MLELFTSDINSGGGVRAAQHIFRVLRDASLWITRKEQRITRGKTGGLLFLRAAIKKVSEEKQEDE